MTNTAHIDWYSFIVRNVERTCTAFQAAKHIQQAVGDAAFYAVFAIGDDGESTHRAGYQWGLHGRQGISVFGGGQEHLLIDVTGTGCQNLRKAKLFDLLIKETEENCNRIDIALDVGDVDPDAIINAGYSNRIATRDLIDSSTGKTWTLGSRTSNRYTKVYRYNSPHPRANQTRVEFTLKGNLAPTAARFYRYYGIQQAISAANNTIQLQWLKDNIEMQHTEEKFVESKVRTKSDEKSMRWLVKQVAPTVHRLLRNQVIDEKWLAEIFLVSEKQKRMFND